MTGPELASLRKSMSLSLSRAAQKLKVSETTLRKWENGKIKPIPEWVKVKLGESQ